MNSPNSALYFDNNATTILHSEVLAEMQPFLAGNFANPSSPFSAARSPALAIEKAREQVAALVGASPAEIIFTSGGSESNNSILHTAWRLGQNGRNAFATLSIEHASILSAAERYAEFGLRTSTIRMNGSGRPTDMDSAVASCSPSMLSAMWANNETGIVLPIQEIAALAHRAGALVHTDAVQAAGKVPLDLKSAGVDYASISAHKLHGPKGVGALYIRKNAPFYPLISGGGQENGRRAGTENVAGIVGFGKAAEIAARDLESNRRFLQSLRDHYERQVAAHLGDLLIAGADAERLPNTSLILFRHVESDALIARLDMDGISASTGSACASGSEEPSHVLKAMGLPVGRDWGVLRISLSRYSTAQAVEYLVERVVHHAKVLRTQP